MLFVYIELTLAYHARKTPDAFTLKTLFRRNLHGSAAFSPRQTVAQSRDILSRAPMESESKLRKFTDLAVGARNAPGFASMNFARSKTMARIGVSAVAIVVVAATAYLSLKPNVNPYGVYSLLAVMAFVLEVGEGVSLGFVFLILSLGHLKWVETLLMADAALLLAAVLYPSRANPRFLLRNLGATSLAAVATHAAYLWGRIPGAQVPAHMFIAACVCFVCCQVFEWRREVLWLLPYYLVAAGISILVPASVVLPVLLLMIWRAYLAFERRLTWQRKRTSEASGLYLQTVEALAVAIEARAQPVSRRSRRVRIYAEEMARELELLPEDREAVRIASILYDIGELAVPEHVILKPGRLTPEEFEKVKTHCDVGAAILERVKFPYPVAPIVRAHHERWDGAGYPLGLQGDGIPIGSRIIAIADAVDSLASPRHHRSAIQVEVAVERVLAEAGRAFDPSLTALLAKRWRRWEKLLAKEAGHGLESIFEAQQEAELLRVLSTRLSAALELDAVFDATVQVLHRLVAFEGLVVWVEKDGRLVSRHVAGDAAQPLASLTIPVGSGVSGSAVTTFKVVTGDPAQENEAESPVPLVTKLRWALAVPLLAENLRGALTLYRTDDVVPATDKPEVTGFTGDHARLVSMAAPLLATAMAKAMKYSDASARAGADSLTGLPNAAALAGRMAALPGPCAVVLCDLDGFKDVNDRFGHLTGNHLLEAIAAGFQGACRTGDFVARLGGDEFVLLLDRGRPEDIEPRLSHFREMVREAGREITGVDMLDASFGTAYYPADSSSPEELLKVADQHMYACKQERKVGVLALEQQVRTADAGE